MKMGTGTSKGIQKTKIYITSQLVLTLLRKEGKFQVETNILEHAIGGVLF